MGFFDTKEGGAAKAGTPPPDGKQPGSNGNNQPPAGTPRPEGKQPGSKGYAYRCIRNCVYGGMARKAGEIIILPEQKEVPHFKPVDAGKE